MSSAVKPLKEKHIRLKAYLKWTLIASAVGVLDSIILLVMHASSSATEALCSAGTRVSCSVIHQMKYSEWFGIPVPTFSLIYYGLVFAVAWAARKQDDKQAIRPYAYLWLLSWLALFSTVYFAYISFFILKTICPYCIVSYLVNLTIWVLAQKMMKVVDQPWGYLISSDVKSAHKSPWFWGTGLISLVILISAHFVFQDRGSLSATKYKITGEETRTLGNPDASVVIADFSDFQCPYCRVAAEVLKQVVEESRGKVRVVYKYYPLDPSCNSSAKWGKHKDACKASRASYCAGLQGQFWPYHDLLFTSQRKLPEARLYKFAKRVGLNTAEFDQCMNASFSEKEIKDDIEEGSKLGIDGTPTLFINGMKYEGPLTVSGLQDTISSISN